MTDIFISYSSKDREWIKPFASLLEEQGYRVWWDTGLLAGHDFQVTIPEKLAEASCVIVVWTENSVGSVWVRAEANRALSRKILVPVWLRYSEIPMPFDIIHAEDFRSWEGDKQSIVFKRLLLAVAQHTEPSLLMERAQQERLEQEQAAEKQRAEQQRLKYEKEENARREREEKQRLKEEAETNARKNKEEQARLIEQQRQAKETEQLRQQQATANKLQREQAASEARELQRKRDAADKLQREQADREARELAERQKAELLRKQREAAERKDKIKGTVLASVSSGKGLAVAGVGLAAVVAGWQLLKKTSIDEIEVPETALVIGQKAVTAVEPSVAKAKKDKYALTLHTFPAYAKITLPDTASNYSKGMSLKPGKYRVEARAVGYEIAEVMVDLTESDQKKTIILDRVKPVLPYEPEMTSIRGGTFIMGCDESRDGYCYKNENAEPHHKVAVSNFLLSKTEVSVGQYLACVAENACPAPEWDENGSKFNVETGNEGHYKKFGVSLNSLAHPVVGVSWENANSFANWMRKRTGRHYRLPTEAEWEFAARAGTKTPHPWGKEDSREHANYGEDWGCCAGKADGEDEWIYTSPVGSFPANPFGLYDMHGNVWEWVQDNYSAYSDEFVRDPIAKNGGEDYLIRGGSWQNDTKDIASVKRVSKKFDTRNNNIGFRLAQSQSSQ